MAQGKEPYAHFDFKVGDFVRKKIPKVGRSNPFDRNELMIVARWYEECAGGIQLFYSCRCVSVGIVQDLIRLNEIEIELIPQEVKDED